jgi:hypothetical protein
MGFTKGAFSNASGLVTGFGVLRSWRSGQTRYACYVMASGLDGSMWLRKPREPRALSAAPLRRQSHCRVQPHSGRHHEMNSSVLTTRRFLPHAAAEIHSDTRIVYSDKISANGRRKRRNDSRSLSCRGLPVGQCCCYSSEPSRRTINLSARSARAAPDLFRRNSAIAISRASVFVSASTLKVKRRSPLAS